MSVALTVDVEPDWGVRGTRAFREVTPGFLRFLERRGGRATFFVVSDLMEVSSDMVAALAERNEVASHGCSHRLLPRMSRSEALRELAESRQRLQEAAGAVRGFRAPFFARRGDLGALLREAGYAYDASLGTVFPGPRNGRFHRLDHPCRWDGLYEFPTSAMCDGLAPLSLTWLRLLSPAGVSGGTGRRCLLYLHLHEFLPPETARCLPEPLRRVLTRNCGRRAWDVLAHGLDRLGGELTTCGAILTEEAESEPETELSDAP